MEAPRDYHSLQRPQAARPPPRTVPASATRHATRHPLLRRTSKALAHRRARHVHLVAHGEDFFEFQLLPGLKALGGGNLGGVGGG